MYKWRKRIMIHSLSLQWFAAWGPPEPAVLALCSVAPCEFVWWLFELLQCPVAASSTAELYSTCFILHLLITCLFHWVPIASTGRDSERSFLFTWHMMLMILYFRVTFLLHPLCCSLKKPNLFALWRNTQTSAQGGTPNILSSWRVAQLVTFLWNWY